MLVIAQKLFPEILCHKIELDFIPNYFKTNTNLILLRIEEIEDFFFPPLEFFILVFQICPSPVFFLKLVRTFVAIPHLKI